MKTKTNKQYFNYVFLEDIPLCYRIERR